MTIIFVILVSIAIALLPFSRGDFVYLEFEGATGESDEVKKVSVCTQISLRSESIYFAAPMDIYALNTSGCSEYNEFEIEEISNRALFIRRGNCPFSTKIMHAAHANAKFLFVASTPPLPIVKLDTIETDDSSLPILIAPYSAFTFMMSTSYSRVSISPLPMPNFNINKIMLLFIALLPLLIGSFFGGCDVEFLRYGLLLRKGEVDETCLDLSQDGTGTMGKLSVLAYIFCLLGLMIAFLLGLYFFYPYLVWIAIFAFCVCTSLATYTVISPFIAQIPLLSCRIPKNNLPILKYRPDPKFFILLPCCFFIPVWWMVCRQAEYAWILQDFLGIILCVYILFLLRFKSAITFLIPLLCTLVVYDVFFVYITPFFTSDGRSIMEFVALGPENSNSGPVSNSSPEFFVPLTSKNSENLPFLFIVPYIPFSANEYTCQFPKLFLTGLGFGDVALPGLYLTYCLYYDNLKGRRFKLTYLVCFLSYALSLILAFFVSFRTKSGQPALLYLVPSTLISTLVLALLRKDLKNFLFGTVKKSDLLMDYVIDSSDEEKKLEL